MTIPAQAARFLGFDPAIVGTLSARGARALAVVSLGAMPGCAAVVLAAGYGTWLASDSRVLGAAVGLGAGLYLANLLRLSLAGGGAAAHEDASRAATWSPRVVPLAIQILLAAFFAQPLLLGLLRGEHDGRVAELRSALVTMHEEAALSRVRRQRDDAGQALQAARGRRDALLARRERTRADLAALDRPLAGDGAATGGGRDVERRVLAAAEAEQRGELEALQREVREAERAAARWTDVEGELRGPERAAYAAHLGRSHFLLRRIQLAWRRPILAASFTGLVVLLLNIPWLLCATVARPAVRAYETARRSVVRSLVEAAYRAARAEEERALRRFATFTGLRLEPFEDAPYNTRPRVPEGRAGIRRG